MKKTFLRILGLCLFMSLAWWGCVRKDFIYPQSQVASEVSPVIGVWENLGRSALAPKMIFEKGGRLTFQGGLEKLNPAQWELHSGLQELTITFPKVDPDQLQVFQLYVGQGVKSFYPDRKQIIYQFNDQTSELNVGGWIYSKSTGRERAVDFGPAEPILK